MMNALRKVLMLLLILLFIAGLYSAKTQQIEKRFTGVDIVSVTTISGDLELRASTDEQVHVAVSHSHSPEHYKATLEQRGKELHLAETFSRGSFSGQSRWIVALPQGRSVTFVSASGGCRAQDLAVDLMVRNASGGIELNRVSGKIEVKTASGDLDGANITGEVLFNAASGNIKLTQVEGSVTARGASSDFWGSGLSGKVEISLASGDLVIRDSTLGLKAVTASGDVSIRDVTLNAAAELKSASGSVLLRLAAPLSADMTLKSASGRVTLQLNGQPADAEFICTVGKDRGRINAPFSFDSERLIEKNGQLYEEKTVKLGLGRYKIVLSVASGDLFVEK